MNSINFQEILAAMSIVPLLFAVVKLIYRKKAFLHNAMMRLHDWGHAPIEISTPTGIVAYLRYTPAALIRTFMKFLVWAGRILYNLHIMLLSANLILIGKNERAIQLAMVFYVITFLFGRYMFKHCRILDN